MCRAHNRCMMRKHVRPDSWRVHASYLHDIIRMLLKGLNIDLAWQVFQQMFQILLCLGLLHFDPADGQAGLMYIQSGTVLWMIRLRPLHADANTCAVTVTGPVRVALLLLLTTRCFSQQQSLWEVHCRGQNSLCHNNREVPEVCCVALGVHFVSLGCDIPIEVPERAPPLLRWSGLRVGGSSCSTTEGFCRPHTSPMAKATGTGDA